MPPEPGNRKWKLPRGQIKWLIDQKKPSLDILKNRLERSQNYSSDDRVTRLLLARRGSNLSQRPLVSDARLPPVDGSRHLWSF